MRPFLLGLLLLLLLPGQGEELISSAQVKPSRPGALSQGDFLDFAVMAPSNSTVEASVGPTRLRLEESAPRFYSGRYHVNLEDRGKVDLTVTATNGGKSSSKQVGQAWLQGLRPPVVVRTVQLDPGRWSMRGKAPADSKVVGTIALRGVGETGFEVPADPSGHFEVELQTQRWFDDRSGRVRLTAITDQGEEVKAPEQKVWFDFKEIYRPAVPGFRGRLPGYRRFPNILLGPICR